MRTRTPISARRFTVALATGAALLASSACGGVLGGSSDDGDQLNLRFAWWGNAERAKTTQKVIDAFQAKHPNIKIKGETTDLDSHFSRLATQVAAGNAPDVITLGGAYPREYGDRGALLDLATVSGTLKTDKIDAASMSNGRFSGKQYGVPSGVNARTLLIDPGLFQQAGVAIPDDDKWTWDDFVKTAKDLAASGKLPKDTYAVQDPTTADMLDVFSRQRGESLYTPDGKVAIGQRTLTDWWNITLQLRDAKASPPAAKSAELMTQTAPEQTLIGQGKAAMHFDWSNQFGAFSKASGRKLQMLRMPGETAGRPGTWLQASQIYSIHAKSKHPKEAAMFIDFLVNSPDAGKLILTDRGIPGNSEVRKAIQVSLKPEEVAQVEHVARMTSLVGPPLVIGPTGSTETRHILDRVNTDVLFNRKTPEQGAAELIKQVNAAIKQ